MGTDIELLRKMIEASSIVEVQQKNSQRTLNLPETETQQGKQYSVNIIKPPAECIAIKSDNFKAPRTFLRREKGQLSRADYILVARHKGKNWIIFIELKSGKADSTKIVGQLKGSECMLEYCRCIGRKFWANHSFLEFSKYQKRFVSIRFTRFSKNRPQSRKKSRTLHDAPERVLTLRGSDQQFKNLLRY